jgi:hypothetical protein
MPSIVDGTVESGGGSTRRVASDRSERIDRGMVIAAIVQAIPWFVWAAPLVLLFGFLALAVWFQRGALGDFVGGVLFWFSRLLIVGGVVLGLIGAWKCYKLYHAFMLDAAVRRTVRAGVQKAVAGARNAELKNDQLQEKIDLEKQLPFILKWAVENGYPVEYGKDGLKIAHQLPGVRVSEAAALQLGVGGASALPGPSDLPTSVLYEDVRGLVPAGHILVGVGRAGRVETKEKAVGACLWIVGLSGTGKTSTTVLRVEERATDGHGFLGIDPHWFKDDSLYHAICETLDGKRGPYARRFLRPMACTPAQQKEVLQFFLDEFNGRKGGRIPKPWRKITLLVDEVGALMDPTTEEEEEIKDMLPTIARICGQEARNFHMGGIFISQQATGLAWLRKMALMVIVHQLLMQNEKELAVNGEKAVAKDMETWPIGRTHVYGVGFSKSGPLTVQQPYFARTAAVDGDFTDSSNDSPVVEVGAQEQEGESPSPVPALSGDLRKVYDACQQLLNQGQRVSARNVEALTEIDKDKANGLLNRLADMGYIERRKAV